MQYHEKRKRATKKIESLLKEAKAKNKSLREDLLNAVVIEEFGFLTVTHKHLIHLELLGKVERFVDGSVEWKEPIDLK